MSKYTTTYAQNREDIIMNAFFDDKASGFYVDVGANHPTKDSVTKLFYEKGWRGINIEPSQRLLKLLIADRPEDINIGKGAGKEKSKVVFRDYLGADGLSTFSDDIKAQEDEYYSPHKQNYVDTELEITTLKDIFTEHQVSKIDFMKVDVEGYEYEVLAGNDWEKFKPELICIESNHVMKDWRPLLESNDYVKFFNDGLNDYYAQKKSPALKSFSFPEKVFMKFPLIVPYIPNYEKVEIEDSYFEEDKKKAPEKVSIKAKIKWDLVDLRNVINEGFYVAIIGSKRRILASRIVQPSTLDSRQKMRAIGRPYMSVKLIILKVCNLFFGIVSRVAYKLVRVA